LRLGVRIPRPLLARVHEASNGNPMFALEFARTVADRGAPGPLPVPGSLQELVRDRVAAYPEGIRPLLEVVAVAQRPTLHLLQRTVDGADGLLDAAVEAGAVTVGDDAVVRFSHPLLATAIYAELLPGRRRSLHGRIGEVVEGLDERARHLALSAFGPDARIARLLDEAAAQARARGAPDAAAELARLGLSLTPASEPQRRADRTLALAGYFADAGRSGDVRASLDELLSGELTGTRRAQALLTRSYAEWDFDARDRLVDEALVHAGDDVALRARLLLAAGHHQMLREDLAAAEPLARQALAEAESAGNPRLLATTLVSVAYIAAVAGWPESDLLDRAIELSDAHGVLPRTVPPRVALAGLRLAVGDLAAARTLLEGELDAIRRSRREYDRRGCLLELFELELYAGDWGRAERYLDEAWELVFDGGDQTVEMVQHGRAMLAAHRGEVDAARRLVAENVERGEPLHWPYLAALNRWTLGFVELSLGEPARAAELLADVADRLGPNRLLRGGTRLAVGDAVEALVGVGRLDEAQALLGRFERYATPEDVWAASALLRGEALILLAQGDAEAARDAAADAATGFEAAGFPFDRGRSLLVAGDALRRMGERRQAADQLETAKELFAQLGAALWLERAEREQRRASPRPRRDRELTNAERRVAALVASGRTNREVAAQLFTTVGTVEVHLTRIYRKLGIRSRTELARRAAAGELALDED
jgi:DNA-binding NarL/FixJ family response regulator